MSATTYGSYLRVPELLDLQTPLSDGPEHDELLFIVIHQTYELWFKQVLHETTALQRALEAGDLWRSLGLLDRIRTILKTLVSQVDILETMTPLQFNSFRARLDSSSGFQSAQFRELEAVLGRRDPGVLAQFEPGSPDREKVERAMSRRPLWGSVLAFLAGRSVSLPREVVEHPASVAYEAHDGVRAALARVYREQADTALLLEKLVDIDEGMQEWRYRHVKMVERTIGTKQGTGGSSGVDYLASTLFRPLFPDLWHVRNDF